MIAQLQNVDPGFIKQFLMLVIGLVGGAAAVAGFFKTKRKIEPQPLEIATAKEYVTTSMCHESHGKLRDEISSHSEQIEKLWSAIRQDKTDMDQAARTRSAGIYTKIDQVRAELAALNDKLRTDMSAGFVALERAIGRLEGKVRD